MKTQIFSLLEYIESSANNAIDKEDLIKQSNLIIKSDINRDLLYAIDYVYNSDNPIQRAESIIETLSNIFKETELEQNTALGKIYVCINIELRRMNKIVIDDAYKERQENLGKKIEEIGKDLTNQKNKIENSTKDFITILGIFAAIFMAFDSGLKIELEILSQVNDYAKGLLIIFIALFTYMLLKSFYKFIVYVYKTNNYPNNIDDYTLKDFLEKPINISLVILAIIYSILVCTIDKQYEHKIEPIIEKKLMKLRDNGNIIIYNNSDTTQTENTIYQHSAILKSTDKERK